MLIENYDQYFNGVCCVHLYELVTKQAAIK